MGDEIVAPQNNVVPVQPVVGGSSKKKWIWISVVGIVVILLVVFGGMFLRQKYVESKMLKMLEYDRDGVYMLMRCIEYCPYKGFYDEKRDHINGTLTFIKEIRWGINQECTRACNELNVDPFSEKYKEIKESFEEKKFVKEYNSLREDFEYYNITPGSCFMDVLRNEDDKSCMFPVSSRVERLESMFVEPTYENVTLNFTSLSCSSEGISMEVDFIEGEISSLGILLVDEGSSAELGREIILTKGLNKIEIKPEEYPLDWKGNRTNPDEVAIFYVYEHEDFPDGRNSDRFSNRYCESQ